MVLINFIFILHVDSNIFRVPFAIEVESLCLVMLVAIIVLCRQYMSIILL